MASLAALEAKEPALTLHHIRHAISSYPNVNTLWNIFSRATAMQGSLKNVQKLLFVMGQSLSRCLPLRVTIGHCHTLNVSTAISEYS